MSGLAQALGVRRVGVKPSPQQIAMIPCDQIDSDPDNPRENVTGVEELAQSIDAIGLLQPVVVRVNPANRDRFYLVAGERRLAAHNFLGRSHIEAIIRKPMQRAEVLAAMIVENGQRVDLDPIEEARAYEQLIAVGKTPHEICQMTGRSVFTVHTRRQLLALPVEEQELLRAGQVTIREANEKAKIASGKGAKPGSKINRAWYFSHTHGLSAHARSRCQRLKHKAGRRVSGGVACGECWESVIRADERQHLLAAGFKKGECVVCGHGLGVQGE